MVKIRRNSREERDIVYDPDVKPKTTHEDTQRIIILFIFLLFFLFMLNQFGVILTQEGKTEQQNSLNSNSEITVETSFPYQDKNLLVILPTNSINSNSETYQETKDTNVYITKTTAVIKVAGRNIVDKYYSKSEYCSDGACIIDIRLEGHFLDKNLNVITTDFNILNEKIIPLKFPQVIKLGLTEKGVRKRCVFTYPDSQLLLALNYFSSMDRACDSLTKLEVLTGVPVDRNYGLIFSTEYSFRGRYYGNNLIQYSIISPNYPGTSTVLVHEIVHSLFEEANFPNWLNEGLADYYSYSVFHKKFKKTGYLSGLDLWVDYDNSDFYDSAQTVVSNFAEKYGDDNLRKLTKYFIDNPLHSSFGVNNVHIIDKMQEITGDSDLNSVEYLANLYSK